MSTPEERLAKFKLAKQKADEEKDKKNFSFPKEEMPDFKVCVLNKDKPKIIRLVGNSPLMREVPSDPLIVKRAFVKTDDDNWATIIMSDNRDHPVNKLWRTIIGKYKWDKENNTKSYDNKGKPSFERFIRNGKKPEDCDAKEKGMQTDTYYMFNCIDKTDDWCKENKHTKLLCWDSTSKEVDGETRTYYTYGVKPSLYNNIFDTQCTKLNRMYDQFDVVVKRLSKKLGDAWITVCIPEEKTAITNMGIDINKVSMDYLTEEEENYEKYKLEDIPFVTRPSSATYVSRILGRLIKQCDIDFGTNLQGEFAEWIEKEKKEWAEKNKNNNSDSENTETSENEVSEKTSATTEQSFDTMETVETSNEELPTEVEEPTPTVTKKVVKVASTFDPLSLKSEFPYIDKLRKEDLALIIGYNSETKELKFKEGIDLAECPCNCTIADAFESCPKCGSVFG